MSYKVILGIDIRHVLKACDIAIKIMYIITIYKSKTDNKTNYTGESKYLLITLINYLKS